MGKKYTRASVSRALHGAHKVLAEMAEESEFEGLRVLVPILAQVADDPTQAPKMVKPPKPPKPVQLDYSGETILVRRIPWGQVGLNLKFAFNALLGVQTKKTNPATGQPFFKSCYDKKEKAFRLPKEKESEIRALIEKEGLAVETTG